MQVANLGDDDYRSLTFAQRGLLHGLELVQAKLVCAGLVPEIPWSTTYLTQELGVRVSKRMLNELLLAGFVTSPTDSTRSSG